MWFRQLFGDTSTFAISVALEDDPAPVVGMPSALRASWGAFELHVGGRCLTRSEGAFGTSNAVQWYLLPWIDWLDRNAVRLLNEEPFPSPTATDEINDALAWLDASQDGPPLSAISADEDEAWFERRSRWREAHTLRAAIPGAVVPNVAFHRVGGQIEISWDNERAAPTRPDLRFVESTGSCLTQAAGVARALEDLARVVGGVVAQRSGTERAIPLANGSGPGKDAWKYLVPSSTAALLEKPALVDLRERVEKTIPSRGAFVPHNLWTSLLRGVPATAPEHLRPLFALRAPAGKLDPRIASRPPSPPPAREPWRHGYAAATRLRAELGWGDEPAPPLEQALAALGVSIVKDRLLDGVTCAAAAFAHRGATVLVQTQPEMSLTMAEATGLGHVLLDLPRDEDFGEVSSLWSHWPSRARAKAFAAMLLLPEDAVRDAVRRRGAIDETLVGELTSLFRAGAHTTTWHLKNLRLISEEARVDLLEKLSMGAPSSARNPARPTS